MVEGTGLTGPGVAARPLLPRVRANRLRQYARVSRMAVAVGQVADLDISTPTSENDPLQPVDVCKSSHSTLGFSRAAQKCANALNNPEYSISR